MKHSLKIYGLGLALASAAILAACTPGSVPGGTIGLPDGSGAEDASIAGSVVKNSSEAAKNATMVLIKRADSKDDDYQVVRTDGNGQYRFKNIPAGTYRLAFVLQSESERKASSIKYYDNITEPDADRQQSREYFSFITTGAFEYDGNQSTSYSVPRMNVGWDSNLQPRNTSVAASTPIAFSWSAVENAQNYVVDIRDSQNNSFYKSNQTTATNFTWSDLQGNQGNNKGKKVQPGETYLYLIAANLDRTANNDGPTPVSGGTALAKFTTN